MYAIIFGNYYSFLSAERMKDYQFKKLKKLLRICQNYVPYYRRLFKEIGFDVDTDFKSIDDIRKIPITTKENVRKYGNEFINEKSKLRYAIKMRTSGSTGKPLTVYVSRKHWVIEQATVWKHWKWMGYHFRNKVGILRSYAPKNNGIKQLIKYDRIRNFIYYSPYDMTETNMKEYVENMIREGVSFLRGYPSSLEILADYILRSGHNIPQIKGIISASEVLSDESRGKIEKAFGAKISNWYGLAECIVTAGECGKHQGMHIFEEYGYMELLDTHVENQKKIIGTNLHNDVMPLLRYETNDIAEMLYEKTNCGHKYRAIKNVIGRSNNLMKLKDRDIPLTNFYTIMEHFPEVLSWQIIQKGQDTVELVLEREITDEIKGRLKEEFETRLPKYVEFKIRDDANFVRSGEGKKIAFMRIEK